MDRRRKAALAGRRSEGTRRLDFRDNPFARCFRTGLCETAAFLKEAGHCLRCRHGTKLGPSEYRDLAIRNGITGRVVTNRFLTKDNEVLGTFALYSPDREFRAEDLALIEARRATSLASQLNANGRKKLSEQR